MITKNTLWFVGRIYIKIRKSKGGATSGGVAVLATFIRSLSIDSLPRLTDSLGKSYYIYTQFANWLVNSTT